MNDLEEDSTTSNNMMTGSSQMCIIDTSIKDVTNNKNCVGLKMESVMRLMREVEREEKAADEAKEEAAQSRLDVLVKLDECKKALRHAEETNDMFVRKLCVQKAVLATKMEVFQLGCSHLLDDGDRIFQVLDEMSRSLEMRLTSALMKKESATKKKQENEAFAGAALAFLGIQMEKVEQEFKNLKQAGEISKLLEFVIDSGQVLDKLHEEISDKYQNVKQLKEELEQGSPLMPILESFKLECSKNEADVPVITRDGFIDFKENSRDVEPNKLWCAKSIEKVKIKKKLCGNIKGFKMKSLRVRVRVSKRIVAAEDDMEMVTLRILFDFCYFICLLLFILVILVVTLPV